MSFASGVCGFYDPSSIPSSSQRQLCFSEQEAESDGGQLLIKGGGRGPKRPTEWSI